MVEATPEPGQESPRRPGRSRRVLFEVLVVVAVYLAISSWQERRLVRTSERAPSFTLESLDGVGNVRGLGMMAAVEVVADRATKQLFPAEIGMSQRRIRDRLEPLLPIQSILCRPHSLRRFQVRPRSIRSHRSAARSCLR